MANRGTTTRTTCPYCGVGCGLLVSVAGDGGVSVQGDPDHPANAGRLCSKGAALGETLGNAGRLLHPELDGARVSWDQALDRLADAFGKAIDRHGPDSVAIYGSGQLLNEDYYVANKLMKGFIGTANLDTNSRLCMASSVAGHRRAFGADTVPGNYKDLELADLVVLTGSNLAWCHPVLYQRLRAAKTRRPTMRVVLIDPRRTASAELADLHLPIAADGDVALFTGLLATIYQQGAADMGFLAAHTVGFSEALEQALGWSLTDLASATGLETGLIERFFNWFLTTEKTVTIYSQGVNQSVHGTDKVNAIINCHLATGRIGRPGMGPFSITGQPNAMGGREVGGLANMLAAHMDLDNPVHRDRVARFWKAPRLAPRQGLKAVDLFQAVERRDIKAVLIMATNPAFSLPETNRVIRALDSGTFIAVAEIYRQTDTLDHAHLKLPARGWGEKDGTVTNSERCISRQRPFLRPPGETRPDWWILCQLAKRLGFGDAFDFSGPAEIFAEHAALSAFENDGSRDFDLSGMAGLDQASYDAMAPVQWPVRQPGQGTERLFGDGRFFTPDRKARLVPVSQTPGSAPPPTGSVMILNTGRLRDQWHGMTRTGRAPRLCAHTAEPSVDLHPLDAARLGILPASLVRVENDLGTVLLRARITDGQLPGTAFAPMHWTRQFSGQGSVNGLTEGRTDPHSHQPALKLALATLAPAHPAWFGFAVSRDRPRLAGVNYWAMSPTPAGYRMELAGFHTPDHWADFIAHHFELASPVEMISSIDRTNGRHGFALISDGRLDFALYVAREPVAISRQWVVDQMNATGLTGLARSAILAGRPGAAQPDSGALLCSCNQVGINTVMDAITRHGCTTLDAVGARTGAGTNCGSCRSDIHDLLVTPMPQAAE